MNSLDSLLFLDSFDSLDFFDLLRFSPCVGGLLVSRDVGCVGTTVVKELLQFIHRTGGEMASSDQIQAQLEGTIQIVNVTGRYAILLIVTGNAPL
jgi:hypothetical protein